MWGGGCISYEPTWPTTEHDIQFPTELKLSTWPIYIPPYQIDLVELKELTVQLQDLFEKGFT